MTYSPAARYPMKVELPTERVANWPERLPHRVIYEKVKEIFLAYPECWVPFGPSFQDAAGNRLKHQKREIETGEFFHLGRKMTIDGAINAVACIFGYGCGSDIGDACWVYIDHKRAMTGEEMCGTFAKTIAFLDMLIAKHGDWQPCRS